MFYKNSKLGVAGSPFLVVLETFGVVDVGDLVAFEPELDEELPFVVATCVVVASFGKPLRNPFIDSSNSHKLAGKPDERLLT